MAVEGDVAIVSGLSGSGKTTALRELEDLGFFCVDSIPANLILNLFEDLIREIPHTNIALVVDGRGSKPIKHIKAIIEALKKSHRVRTLFFEAETDTILRRYKETRRRHPFLKKGESLAQTIDNEAHALRVVRNVADKIIDTTDMTVHSIKSLLRSYYHHLSKPQKMQIQFLSFGYKYGLPTHADLILDVRFLPNPYFKAKLKEKNGLQKSVQNYVLEKEEAQKFLQKSKSFIGYLLKEYQREGKSFLTIGLGCTGGKHRSVTIVETLKKHFKAEGFPILVNHRDIDL